MHSHQRRPRDQQREPATAAEPRRLPGPATILALQRTAGNQAVARMLAARRPRAADEMRAAAGAAEQAPPDRGPEPALPHYRASSLQEETERIRAQAETIRGEQETMEEALAAGPEVEALNVKPEMAQDNEKALRELDAMLAASEGAGGTLEAFQAQLGNLDRDHARLLAEMTAYAATRPGAGTFTTRLATASIEKGQGKGIGAREVASAHIAPGEFGRLAARGGNAVAPQQGRVEAARSRMAQYGAAAGTLYEEFRGHAHEARAKAEAIEAHVATIKLEDAQKELAELREVREGTAATRESLNAVGELVAKLLGLGGWLDEPIELHDEHSGIETTETSGDTREAATSLVTWAALVLFDLSHREEDKRLHKAMERLQKEIAGFTAAKRDHETQMLYDQLAAATDLMRAKGTEVVKTQGLFKQAQHDYRASMADMGAAADTAEHKGGDRFEAIAQLLAEADAYGLQAGIVAELGKRYLADVGEGGDGGEHPGRTIRHWPPGKRATAGKVMVWGPSQPAEAWVSTWHRAAAAGNVRSALADLGVQRVEIAELAAELRRVFESRGR